MVVAVVPLTVNPVGAGACVCAKTVEDSRNNNIDKTEPKQCAFTLFIPIPKKAGLHPDMTWPVVALPVGMLK